MKTTIKLKRCKVCPEKFQPYSSLTKVCSTACALVLVDKDKDKKHRKEAIQWRKDNKKISEHIADAQTVVNQYIRLRDHDKPCISCPTSKDGNYLTGSNWDAGHYRSRGSAPHLRFNTNNIFRQCVKCNRELSGNTVEMRKGMIKRLGVDKVEALEVNNGYKKFNREYCERVKKIFNKKTRIKRKRLGIE